MEASALKVSDPDAKSCVRCGATISGMQPCEVTPEGVVCGPCYGQRGPARERERDLKEQGREINYPMALAGALLGGSVGVLAWWFVTVWSRISFGIVAILIGIAVGKGVILASGNRRSRALQVMSVSVAGVSYFYALYLVNRTFIQQALAQQGKIAVLPLLPDPFLLARVIGVGFDAFGLFFLAIVLWEAWRLTAPLKAR
jgi:hypothetical protein